MTSQIAEDTYVPADLTAFICYRHVNRGHAEKVRDALRVAGVEASMDDAFATSNFEHTLQSKILVDRSDVVVVVLPSDVKSWLPDAIDDLAGI